MSIDSPLLRCSKPADAARHMPVEITISVSILKVQNAFVPLRQHARAASARRAWPWRLRVGSRAQNFDGSPARACWVLTPFGSEQAMAR